MYYELLTTTYPGKVLLSTDGSCYIINNNYSKQQQKGTLISCQISSEESESHSLLSR